MTPVRVGDRIPRVRLPEAGSGRERPVRGAPRDALILVALHDPACERCRFYLRSLAGARSAFRLWDGEVRALTDDAGGLGPGESPGDGVEVLVDGDRLILGRLPTRGGPVVVVADRYGQVFEILDAGSEHAFAPPRELEEWLRYLATQCPE